MSSLSLTNPTIGQPNSTEDVDIVNALIAIQTWANGNVDFSNLGGTVQSDYSEVFRNNQIWDNVTQGSAATWAVANNWVPTLTLSEPNCVIYLDPSDYALTSRTAKYRLRVMFDTNAVAPAITFTFGLYPITIVRGASGSHNTFTFGTVIAGSTVAFASPAANSTTVTLSSDFTAPTVGAYAYGIVTSGVMAAGTRITSQMVLQRRTV